MTKEAFQFVGSFFMIVFYAIYQASYAPVSAFLGLLLACLGLTLLKPPPPAH